MPVYHLTDECRFPAPHLALRSGLLAVGGDLSVERLILAYASGIFPWYSEGDPILWWSPDPRYLITAESLRVSKRLARTLRRAPYTITMDTAFEQVIAECARPRGGDRDSTWITQEMQAAFIDLHQHGIAHSVECWKDGQLAGGLYGVALGRIFSGESMFANEPDASKVALVTLVRQLTAWGFECIDCQLGNPHLESLGAFPVPRAQFLERLARNRPESRGVGPWRLDPDIIPGAS